MLRGLVVGFAVTLFAFATSAWASELEEEVKPIPAFLGDCEAGDPHLDADCTQVVRVVLASVATYKLRDPNYPVCLPPGLTAQAARPAVLRQMFDHPVATDKNAAVGIVSALRALYPCEKP